MSRPALIDTITQLAEPIVQSVGLEVWGVELLQYGRPVVRVFVDTPRQAEAGAAVQSPAGATDGDSASADGDSAGLAVDGEAAAGLTSATVDQCADISRMLGLALEVEDVFASAYVLEVSSPGLSRTFFAPEQLAAYVGDTVEMSLVQAPAAFAGRKKFRGQLQAVQGDTITLVTDGAEGTPPAPLTVRWEDIRKITRVHIFPVKEKPGKKKQANATS